LLLQAVEPVVEGCFSFFWCFCHSTVGWIVSSGVTTMKTHTSSEKETARKRIVVLGGTGLIGSQVVNFLRERGCEVIAASPSTGVNALTGQGLAEAFAGADVVVDVTNSPSFEDKAVMSFFETSGRNLAAAEQVAGVKHHVALSVVGTDDLPESGYFRAKLAQENLIKGSGIPYSIVRATQFHEFTGAIAQSTMAGEVARVPTALFQPIAAADVAAAVADAALAKPLNGISEVVGPERISMAIAVRRFLESSGDKRTVVDDPTAKYFGIVIDDRSLAARTPDARPGRITFDSWLNQSAARR
jgi:uncharacterized protein YbjT (DUF2867 family)